MAEPAASATSTGTFAGVWQAPALLLGIGLLTVGLYFARTAPEPKDYPGALDSVDMYLKAHQFDQAKQKLDFVINDYEQVPREQQARARMLAGDLVFLTQQQTGGNLESNNRNIVKHYEEAETLGARLSAPRLQRLAETKIAMGKYDQAMAVLDRLREDDQPAEYRYNIVKQIIRNRNQSEHASPGDFAPLLARFEQEIRSETDQVKRRAQQIWLTAFRAKRLLDGGDAPAAAKMLAMQLPRYMAEKTPQGAALPEDDLAPLEVLLAKSLQSIGEFYDARTFYADAAEKLNPTDPLNADILIGQGQIELAISRSSRASQQAALGMFTQAATRFPDTEVQIRSLLGKGDCAALLGFSADALDCFNQVVDLIKNERKIGQKHVGPLQTIVYSHFDIARDGENFEWALDLLETLRRLHGDENLPASLLVKLAVTEQLVAEQWQQQAETMFSEQQGLVGNPSRAAMKTAFRTAWVHYGKAGDYFMNHAQAVTVADDEEHGLSLWRAAENYDKAHQWNDAIAAYKEFVRTRSKDPKILLARRRLAQAFAADGQYDVAAQLYQKLIDDFPKGPETYASLTPLARCHIELGDYDAAERGLLQVLTNHPAITPQAPEYRDALIELGNLYYEQAKFFDAIGRLDEAVRRFGDAVDGPVLQFRLADAYRQSVKLIDKALEEPMPTQKRDAKQAQRATHLEQAQGLFGEVIGLLEERHGDSLSELETLYLRNAYLYQSDCAYDLGRFDEAIQLYGIAAKQLEGHPASLIALVQIVNAYCEMGKEHEARSANRRASYALQNIPDAAFDEPGLPMTREHWQTWLRWSKEYDLFDDQTASALR